jgi:DNA-directed RNA polymerase subunit RPC12/RpoP
VQYDLDWANDVLLPGEDGCPCDPKTRSIDEIQIGDQFWILLTDNKRWLKGTVKERKGHTTFELKWPDTQVLWLPRKEDDSNHSDLCMAPPEARAVHTDPEPKEPKSFETLSFANGARPNPRWTMETVCPDCGYKWKYHYSSWISCKHVCVVTPGPEEWELRHSYDMVFDFERYIKDTGLLQYGLEGGGPGEPPCSLILLQHRHSGSLGYVMRDATCLTARGSVFKGLDQPKEKPTPLACETLEETADSMPKEKDMKDTTFGVVGSKPNPSWNMTTVCPECNHEWIDHYSRHLCCKYVDVLEMGRRRSRTWNELMSGYGLFECFRTFVEQNTGPPLLLIASPRGFKKKLIVRRDPTKRYGMGAVLDEQPVEGSSTEEVKAEAQPKPKTKPLLKHNYNVHKCSCDLGDRGCMCPRPEGEEKPVKPVCNHAELQWVNESIVKELGYLLLSSSTVLIDYYRCMQCGRIFGLRVFPLEKKEELKKLDK